MGLQGLGEVFLSLSLFLFGINYNCVVNKMFLGSSVTLVVDVLPLQRLAPVVISGALSEECGFQKWRWKLSGIHIAKLSG